MELNLNGCRVLHRAGLIRIAEVCPSLQKLNIEGVFNLSDESVNTFVELRGPNMKMLKMDGGRLSDCFCTFHKMENLEELAIMCCAYLDSAGLSSICRLSKLGKKII